MEIIEQSYLNELKKTAMKPLNLTQEEILKELRKRKAKQTRDQQLGSNRKRRYGPKTAH